MSFFSLFKKKPTVEAMQRQLLLLSNPVNSTYRTAIGLVQKAASASYHGIGVIESTFDDSTDYFKYKSNIYQYRDNDGVTMGYTVISTSAGCINDGWLANTPFQIPGVLEGLIQQKMQNEHYTISNVMMDQDGVVSYRIANVGGNRVFHAAQNLVFHSDIRPLANQSSQYCEGKLGSNGYIIHASGSASQRIGKWSNASIANFGSAIAAANQIIDRSAHAIAEENRFNPNIIDQIITPKIETASSKSNWRSTQKTLLSTWFETLVLNDHDRSIINAYCQHHYQNQPVTIERFIADLDEACHEFNKKHNNQVVVLSAPDLKTELVRALIRKSEVDHHHSIRTLQRLLNCQNGSIGEGEIKQLIFKKLKNDYSDAQLAKAGVAWFAIRLRERLQNASRTTDKYKMFQNELLHILKYSNNKFEGLRTINILFTLFKDDPAFNASKSNNCFSRLFKAKHDQNWKDMVLALREEALGSLAEYISKDHNRDTKYLIEARQWALFNEHRNKHWYEGAFGRTSAVKQLDQWCDAIKKGTDITLRSETYIHNWQRRSRF